MTQRKTQIILDDNGSFRRTSAYQLGEPICLPQLLELISRLSTTICANNNCLGTIQILYQDHPHMNYTTNKLLIQSDFADKKMFPCDTSLYNAPPSSKVHACAHNLSTGKCRDEFIRNTVGAILFPQFYANTKQK